jgi:hypothetical protein
MFPPSLSEITMDMPGLPSLINFLPKLRTGSQLTLGALITVSALVLGFSEEAQQLPVMLVIATIPLVITVDHHYLADCCDVLRFSWDRDS